MILGNKIRIRKTRFSIRHHSILVCFFMSLNFFYIVTIAIYEYKRICTQTHLFVQIKKHICTFFWYKKYQNINSSEWRGGVETI